MLIIDAINISTNISANVNPQLSDQSIISHTDSMNPSMLTSMNVELNGAKCILLDQAILILTSDEFQDVYLVYVFSCFF